MRRSKLSALAAAVAALAPAVIAAAAPVNFKATFATANNSGVTGTAQLSLDGNALTVSIQANGLEPGQVHAQHIHGFADGRPSVLPPPVLTPQIDTNQNGLLDDPEAEALVGPPLVTLTLSGNTKAPEVSS